MQHHLNLQLQLHEPTQAHSETSRKEGPAMRDWMAAFNTAVLTTLTDSAPVASDLPELMASPEFAALIIAAGHLADSQKLSPEDAAERIVRCFRQASSIWNTALLKRGMQSMLG